MPLFIPHLGCPNECVFCDQKRISGSPLPVSGETVAARLEEARRQGERGLEAAFYGGSFTAMSPAYQETLLAAAAPFLRDGTLGSIRLSTRPDAVDGDA
ncbi:MAG: radical SAM protein, partial [Oscillospiraceae bacterium]|nr:radical SAM protein [Oscillospiraceae bacterium]